MTDVFNELSARLPGRVRTDPFTRSLYATDASIYEIEPLAVATPRDSVDVQTCVRFAATHKIPIVARGAGTGLAGESLGRALILDLSVHFKRIDYDAATRTVRVGTGVVLDELNRALKPHGVYLPVDPSSASRCTLGGMIANNASGARSLRFGDTRRNLHSARVILADGTELLAEPTALDALSTLRASSGLAGAIYSVLPELLARNAATITAATPRTERNSCGYALHAALKDGVFDFAKLLCGSQGTLGIVTEATFRVSPLPAAVGMCVVYFESLADAARAILTIRAHDPLCCELMDGTLMRLGRGAKPELAHRLPEHARAMLIVEMDGSGPDAVRARLDALAADLRSQRLISFDLVPDLAEQKKIWSIRNAATPLLFQRTDRLQPTPFVEDGAVPPEHLGNYLARAAEIFEAHGIEWSAYAHAGAGEVHIRPMLDLRDARHAALLEPIAAAMHQAVWNCGGVISGEHGDGLARTQWLEKQFGAEMFALFKRVKELCDPLGILNPDKKISADPHLMTSNLRLGGGYKFSARVEASLLRWPEDTFAAETERCNGCAHCRTPGPEEDMCPRFKHYGVEAASPRAKANAVRRLQSLRQNEGGYDDDAVREIMDFCFNCKLCVDGCPSKVNIPRLVMEAKARHHRTHALPPHVRFFARGETFLRMGQFWPALANASLRAPLFRAFLERVVGVDRRRPLPPIRPFRMRHKGGGHRPVALYPDLYARYNAPEITQAAVDVLEVLDFSVTVIDAPWTNLPAIESGALDTARRTVRDVTALLAPFAHDGIPILATEASAALALKEEFLAILDTPQTRAVAAATHEIGAFLRNEKFPEFRPLPARNAYMQACHQKALHGGAPLFDLLRSVPELEVEFVRRGCCGMAGTFGMARAHFDESMAIGRLLFDELKRAARPFHAVLSESSACKMQCEFGGGVPGFHPIQWLAAALGSDAVALPLQSAGSATSAASQERAQVHGYH